MKQQIASTVKSVNESSAPKSTDKKTQNNFLQLKVYSPYQIYFDEPATSISAVNDTGPFDVLPKHHNFLTLLSPGELAIKAPHGDRNIRISHGIMHVKSNKVTVFLDV